jgi:hypothetical protein
MATESAAPHLEVALHHVGGRGGTGRFPQLQHFARDFAVVLYEADESCIEEMTTKDPSHHIIPRCVADRSAPTEFNVLYNASASSVHDVDPRFLRDLPWLGEGSIDYDDAAWATVRRVSLTGAPLDELLHGQYPGVPPPDFLSLNTQGNEADILAGARDVLSRSCVAVQLEVSLRPIYRDQSTFDQVTRDASRLGFELARLLPHGDRGQGFTVGDRATRTPLGLRGGGVTLQADAIFFKTPDAILSGHANPMIDLIKGLFVSFVLSYFDYSYACAESFLRLADPALRAYLSDARDRYAYVDFALSYLDEVERHPRIFPVTWTDVFAAGSDKPRSTEEIRERYFKVHDRDAFTAGLSALTDRGYVAIERLAVRFGFRQQAELLKRARLAAIWDTLRRLGLESTARV